MLWRPLFSACVVVGALAGCVQSDKQWLKVNESYTTAEFRRDHAACSKGAELDEACLRAKGWVDVAPSARDRAVETPPPGPAPQNYRYRR